MTEIIERDTTPNLRPIKLGRLTRGSDIRRVLRYGRGSGNSAGHQRTLPGPGPVHRICIVASRKVGKAHDRNRTRRRIREILRHELRDDVEPLDLVLRLRPGVAAMSFDEVRRCVGELLERTGIRAART